MLRSSLPSANVALVVPSYGLKPSYNVPFSVGPDPEMSRRNGITVPFWLMRLASHRPSMAGVPAAADAAAIAPSMPKMALRPVTLISLPIRDPQLGDYAELLLCDLQLMSRCILSPLLRQSGLRAQQDFENRLPVLARQRGEVLALIRST